MSTRSPDVPRFSYLLAVVAGLFALPLVYLLADSAGGGEGGSRLLTRACFAVLHAVPGAAFGLVWPDITWRWGVWLCAVPAVLVSFLARDAWFFPGWLMMTMLPACAGAYAAARLHLKYAEVG